MNSMFAQSEAALQRQYVFRLSLEMARTCLLCLEPHWRGFDDCNSRRKRCYNTVGGVALKAQKEVRLLTRKQFQLVAQLRADETEMLAKNGKKMGAFYLGGLAIECALKACIAKKTKRYDFPRDRRYVERVYSHDLSELLKLAGLNDQLDQDSKNNQNLATNWGVVKSWNVDSRYEASGLKGSDMDVAVNSTDGVLQWIKLRW